MNFPDIDFSDAHVKILSIKGSSGTANAGLENVSTMWTPSSVSSEIARLLSEQKLW